MEMRSDQPADEGSGLRSDGVSPAEAEAALTAAVVRLALTEDVGTGDVTTLATIPAGARARAVVVARAAGVFSGAAVAEEIARAAGPGIACEMVRHDGDALEPGDLVLRMGGPARNLLTLERVLLNFLQRLSGVATLTARYVEALRGTGVAVADTRKTTPGLRRLEKAAVLHGGGVNHRMGLFDAYMIKDNHIAAAGGIGAAVERARAGPGALALIVEADTLAQAEEAARLRVDQILLDNMSPEEIGAAVAAVRRIEAEGAAEPARQSPGAAGRRIRIEVSGGVTLDTVRRKALPGVDLISIGALTHSAPALDLAMELELDPDATSAPGHPRSGAPSAGRPPRG